MKRFLILIIVVVVAFSLVSCAKSDETTDEVLKVGMELKWPPFETTDESGNAVGISVMLAEELGDYLGMQVEIVDLPFGSLISALETEKIDVIIGSMGITEERMQKIDFSDPYNYFKILSIVNNESGITDLQMMYEKEGVRFVAPKSFSTLDIAREKANNPQIIEFDDKATAVFELANGNADVFMVDAASAISIQKSYPDALTIIYEPAQVSPIGMGVKKGNEELLSKLNEFITKRDELGVNERIAAEYDDELKEIVGKGLDFYLYED